MPYYPYDDRYYGAPVPVVVPAVVGYVQPYIMEREHSPRKEMVTKSRSESFKDAQEFITSQRQKYEPEILDLEGKLDSLMYLFDASKNEPKDQSNKRKAVCFVDNARDFRQRWVNKLDEMWEKYEKEYNPLTEAELAAFETAVARAAAPMDVQDRGISLVGGPHETRPATEPSRRAIEPSRRDSKHLQVPEPSPRRSTATGRSQHQEFSTAVTSRLSQRPESSASRASSARNSTARPTGARVAETGSFARKPSRLGEEVSSGSMSTYATSRHTQVRVNERPDSTRAHGQTSVRGYQPPESTRAEGSSRLTSRSTARPEPRTELLRQATRASSYHPTAVERSHVSSSSRSSRR